MFDLHGHFDPPRTDPYPMSTSTSGQDSETFLLPIGDIGLTEHWVVTPAGSYPVSGTQRMMPNNAQTTESIRAEHKEDYRTDDGLLGLLFLPVKERKTSGYVQVRVQGPGLYNATAPGLISGPDRRHRTARQLRPDARRPLSHPSWAVDVA